MKVTLVQLTQSQWAFWISQLLNKNTNLNSSPPLFMGMDHKWFICGTKQADKSCQKTAVLSPNNSTSFTHIYTQTNLLFDRGRNSYPFPALLWLFLTCVSQAGLSHIKPGIIQHFILDLLVLVEFVLPCSTWKTKSLLQVSCSSCIPISQKGQTHLLAATMHHRSPL